MMNDSLLSMYSSNPPPSVSHSQATESPFHTSGEDGGTPHNAPVGGSEAGWTVDKTGSVLTEQAGPLTRDSGVVESVEGRNTGSADTKIQTKSPVTILPDACVPGLNDDCPVRQSAESGTLYPLTPSDSGASVATSSKSTAVKKVTFSPEVTQFEESGGGRRVKQSLVGGKGLT